MNLGVELGFDVKTSQALARHKTTAMTMPFVLMRRAGSAILRTPYRIPTGDLTCAHP